MLFWISHGGKTSTHVLCVLYVCLRECICMFFCIRIHPDAYVAFWTLQVHNWGTLLEEKKKMSRQLPWIFCSRFRFYCFKIHMSMSRYIIFDKVIKYQSISRNFPCYGQSRLQILISIYTGKVCFLFQLCDLCFHIFKLIKIRLQISRRNVNVGKSFENWRV